MKVIRDAYRTSDLPRGTVATIGNYDGIHRGQQAILERVVARAEEEGVPSAVITFAPHPAVVLKPSKAPPMLTTPSQKLELLAAAGIDITLLVTFDTEVSRSPAEEFVRRYLVERMAIRELYVGADFVFGHQRDGDLPLLERLGRELGFAVEGVDEVVYRGDRISSTRIRQAIAECQVDEAMEMLGRAYTITGKVVRGDRMGQRLGWPTMNLDPDNELIPGDGVYAGRAEIPSFPASFDCAINVGTRPTVYENFQRVVESHLLDFSTDIYGEQVAVSFHKHLREERIFPTVMDLSAQIRRDVEETREYFIAHRRSE